MWYFSPGWASWFRQLSFCSAPPRRYLIGTADSRVDAVHGSVLSCAWEVASKFAWVASWPPVTRGHGSTRLFGRRLLGMQHNRNHKRFDLPLAYTEWGPIARNGADWHRRAICP